MSPASESWRDWNPIMSSTGKDLEMKFDKSKCYVLAFPKDRSIIMIAPFNHDSKDPFTRIATWLDENFNPGTDSSAKTNPEKGVHMYLLLPSQHDKVVEAFAAMGADRVLFRVVKTQSVVMTPYTDGKKMLLSTTPGSNLEIGEDALRLPI